MNMLFRAQGLEAALSDDWKAPTTSNTPTEAETKALRQWNKDDAKAASLIGASLSRSIGELVLTCSTAKEVWSKLCARYERSSSQRLNTLIESFFRVTKKDSDDIGMHIAKLQKLYTDLNSELVKNKENTLSERILIGRILSTLGKEYDNFRDLWETILSKDQKLNLLIEKLSVIESREVRLESISPAATALVTDRQRLVGKGQKGPQKKDNDQRERAKQKFPCRLCKKLGHWAAECPSKSQEKPFSLMTKAGDLAAAPKADHWYCARGASGHIT